MNKIVGYIIVRLPHFVANLVVGAAYHNPSDIN